MMTYFHTSFEIFFFTCIMWFHHDFITAVLARCQVALGWENRRKQWDVVSYSFGDVFGCLKKGKTQNKIWTRTPKVTKWCYHVVSWLELTKCCMAFQLPAPQNYQQSEKQKPAVNSQKSNCFCLRLKINNSRLCLYMGRHSLNCLRGIRSTVDTWNSVHAGPGSLLFGYFLLLGQ